MCSDSLAWKMPNVSMPGAARSMLLIVNLALLPTLTSLQAWPGWKTGCPTCGQKPKNAIEQQLHVVGVLRFFCALCFSAIAKSIFKLSLRHMVRAATMCCTSHAWIPARFESLSHIPCNAAEESFCSQWEAHINTWNSSHP